MSRARKAVAELLAGLIPHRMTRNRMRGLLRYGLFRAIGLRRRMRDRPAPRHYLAVCAIAKNEGPYIKEWLDWHLGRGVEKFYLYDNESADDTRGVLEPYIASGVVDYTYFPGRRRQLPAYDDCLEKHRLEARWMAFIDLDEFITPLRHGSIPEFLKPLEKYPVVEVNWLVWGSGGARAKQPGGVRERFKAHAAKDHEVNRHVKSIVDPRRVACMVGCHEATRLTGCAVDERGERIRRNFQHRAPRLEIIRVDHYATKSREEFEAKKARGRARALSLRDDAYFARFDRNECVEV